jgi:hypothetical protein
MEGALENLEVGSVRIEDGSFTVSRAYDESSPPLVLNGIDIVIDEIGRSRGGDSNPGSPFMAAIRVETGPQDIRFPDGIHGMRFLRMRLDTRSGQVALDSCLVYGNRSDSNRAEFDILFDSLRIEGALPFRAPKQPGKVPAGSDSESRLPGFRGGLLQTAGGQHRHCPRRREESGR